MVVSVRTRARVTERVRLRARVWVTVFLRVRMGRLSLVRRSQQDDGEGLSAMRWSEGLTVSWWPHRCEGEGRVVGYDWRRHAALFGARRCRACMPSMLPT